MQTPQSKEIKEIYKSGGWSRLSTFKADLPISVATMWRWCQKGAFPKPVKLSENVTAWRNDELNQWFSEPSKKFDEAA